MTYKTYINVTDDFVKGIQEYLVKKEIPPHNVVEVFAGDGTLGMEIGLPADLNISDLLTFNYAEHKDIVNRNWSIKPDGVVEESAYETVIRFSAEDKKIQLLIMGAPSESDDAYEAAKALHYLFDGKILYIGEWDSTRFASIKFFDHMEDVADDEDQSFEILVQDKYVNDGYFTSDMFEFPLDVQPYLKRFKLCQDQECDCRNFYQINRDVKKYIDKNK